MTASCRLPTGPRPSETPFETSVNATPIPSIGPHSCCRARFLLFEPSRNLFSGGPYISWRLAFLLFGASQAFRVVGRRETDDRDPDRDGPERSFFGRGLGGLRASAGEGVRDRSVGPAPGYSLRGTHADACLLERRRRSGRPCAIL